MNKYFAGGIVVLIVVAVVYLMSADRSHQEADKVTNTMNTEETKDSAFLTIAPNVELVPVAHASAVMQWGDVLVFADPVGEAELYTKYGTPDIVFITHRHGDHLDSDHLPQMLSEATTLIAPQDVVDALPEGITANIVVMAVGEVKEFSGLTFEAVPAYNVREEAQNYHPRSRGDNGYVISDRVSRVYFSGDTEGHAEMRALTDIDVAFVAMNLPYTMDVDDAADAVLAFAPKTVYPYHFRTPDGFSDVEKFKELVTTQNTDIKVEILDWYHE